MQLISLISFVIWQADPRGDPATSARPEMPARRPKIARERHLWLDY
jgi:hypothetical protein